MKFTQKFIMKILLFFFGDNLKLKQKIFPQFRYLNTCNLQYSFNLHGIVLSFSDAVQNNFDKIASLKKEGSK